MRSRLAQTRLGAAILAAWGVLVGVGPHVLHHVGPFAGAALLAGAGGKLLGALGLLLSIPFLLRLYRLFHTLAAPVLATAAFATISVVSTLVVSPLLTDGGGAQDRTPGVERPAGHASHHPK